ncbi:MAG TPA: hypothetical protein PKN54_07965 [Candidatus Cloacimonas acidaminovorans]|nr:hypothetical protein [Candidatus Cloacimonas acidaminovorans]
MEQVKALTKNTLIPLGLAVSLAGIVFAFGVTYQRIQALEERNSPTRDEFTTLQSDIKEIKTDVKSLIISSK